jgi:hypothetical protein
LLISWQFGKTREHPNFSKVTDVLDFVKMFPADSTEENGHHFGTGKIWSVVIGQPLTDVF